MTPGLMAQVPSRIESAITSARRAVLAGSLRPLARSQFDAGAMPPSTPLHGISMTFSLSPAQQADLDSLLADQQNPASPFYHQWLTPAQFGARFGMSSADLAKVEAWLQQEGFHVDSVAPSRNRIRFSGTAAQVAAAFAAPMRYYQINGVRHFAPASALSLPAALAPAVAGIGNLDDFRPRPRFTRIPAGSNPHFTSSVSGNVFFAPGDIATAYDLGPLYSAGDNGAGQSIAIVGQSAIALSDIEAFQSAAGLTVKDPLLILVPGTGDSTVYSSDEAESDLDVEWAGATAPGATIDFVYVGSDQNYGEFDALTFAVHNDLAPIISTSYGNCEAAESSLISTYEGVLKQAAAQGQTVTASGSDEGSTDCSGVTGLTTTQQEALAVDYPASSAYVSGIGGTEVPAADLTTGTGTGNWQAASGQDVLTSALKYIPETAWNDDSATNGISAGGGGASSIFAKPTWQANVPGIPADSKRDVPDIALYASPSSPGYLYCTSDPTVWSTNSNPPQAASCDSGFRDSSSSDLTVAGGTSFGAPIFAGMVAILNQAAGYTNGQGLVNPTLYSLAGKSATYSAAFHDVTTGNNNCTAGAADCGTPPAGGFSAGVGYDLVTGLGSVDLHQLALAWPLNTNPTLIATTTAVSASSTTPAVNASVTFTITVASVGGGATPTGSVKLLVDGAPSTSSPLTLTANGTAVFATSFATTGAHQVLAFYQADAGHAASTGVITINVPLVSSGTGSFTLAATPVTVASGASANSTITVTPAGGYTGTVLLSVSTSNASALANLCYQFASTTNNGTGDVAVGGTTAVTTQLTLDANAADCSAGALRGGSGKRAFRALQPIRSSGVSGGRGLGLLSALAALASLALMCIFCGGFRRYRVWAGLIVLVAVGLASTACGGGGNNNGNNPGAPSNPAAGNYTITVTGADSVTPTITASTTFTFVIQ